MKKVILKKGREKSVLRNHPWIFSGAIDKEEKDIKDGEEVEVYSRENRWLARGIFSGQSQIRVRLFAFNNKEKLDKEFIRNKILSAADLRNKLNFIDSSVYRLFFSESDGIPGLIIDKYDKIFVCMFLSVGAEKFKKEIVEVLVEEFSPESIYERSDSEVRLKEGLSLTKGLLYGKEPPDLVEVIENKLKILVDIKNGHKTGFYIDQRNNRFILGNYSEKKEILNCFSYTGGFAISALLNNALHVTNIDSSADALEMARKNLILNNISESRFTNVEGDVFKELRALATEERKFDIVILDPPKFADSKSNVYKAARGYKDINFNALKLIQKGGLLFSFSCSGLISTELFQKIIADAAVDAGRNLKFIEQLRQAQDHPVSSNFPESMYLKGFVAYVE